MAYEVPGFGLGTLTAAADLSALQYRFVVVNASGDIAQSTASGDVAGVLQNKPTLGEAAQVMTDGVSKVVAGAAVAAGAKVMSNASGQAITATATNKAVGMALAAAAAAGEIIPVLLKDLGTQ